MKRIHPITGVLIFLVLACNSGPASSANEDTAATRITPIKESDTVAVIGEQQCFVYTSGRDSVLLSIQQDANEVSGQLIYSIYEKDRNSGTISGRMIGDTLYADYRFISEGSQSVREVVFLKKGDSFIEGFGKVEEKNGKMVLADKGSIRFDNKMLLKEEKCK